MKDRYKILQVGIFMFLALLCLGYLTINLGKVPFLAEDGAKIFARFNSVNGLKNGADIEISGVKIGRVGDIWLDTTDDTAMVELYIDKGIDISEDSMASIKTTGIIGEKYINIRNGASLIFLENDSIITDTQSPMNLEDLISKYLFGDINANK